MKNTLQIYAKHRVRILKRNFILKENYAANSANPTSYIDSNDPPFLIQHGTEDQLIPFTQSSNFYHALIDQLGESQVSYDLIEGAGHGGGLFVNQTNLEKVFSFLNMHLK